MKIWIDAQLPPTLADWITNTFAIEAFSLKEIGGNCASIQIFMLLI